MNPLSPQEQAQREVHRARYEALRAAGQGQTARSLPPPTDRAQPVPAGSVLHHEQLPGGWYWSTRLACGEVLRIGNPSGASTASVIAWSVADPSERLNLADTIKVQWSASLRKGRILLTDMGRVALSLVEDTCGAHDVLVGPTTAASMHGRLGEGAWRNTRDNFLAAAAKLGFARRDIPPSIGFFAPVGVDEAGRFVWHAQRRKRGDFVDLRAEMDLWIVVSNAGHPLDPAIDGSPAALDLTRWRSAASGADDLCRRAGPEAQRAFEFTDRVATR
jgi:urea carboxylase-associated protein 2